MYTSISTKDKKSFIQWFLNHYHLKKRECVWILNYLMNHEDLLENIHFVRDAKFCPRAIAITADCSREVAFRFYKKPLVSIDVEKAFHDIRLNSDKPFYIQLNFDNSNQNPLYAFILEENPYYQDKHTITEDDRNIAKQLLTKSLRDFQIETLKKQIDESLDEMDHTKFIALTTKLHQLKSNTFQST